MLVSAEVPRSKKSCADRWKRTTTSVAVIGMHLPARMATWTPSQRGESTARRTAAKDSVVDPAATPATSR